MLQSTNEETLEIQKQSQSSNFTERNNDEPVEQELIFILENGTEPTPVRAIKRPEPKLHAPVHVPFPPDVNAADLIRTNKSGKLLARCTNKFLIYRNEFAREVRKQGYNLSMSEVSCLAAQAWKKEPSYVIRKYADIAHEVKWLHKQLSRSNSKNNKRRITSDLSFHLSSPVEKQAMYMTQPKRASLLTQQFSPVTFQQQHNDTSPLLTPLTPTMISPTLIYYPRVPNIAVSDNIASLNAATMISPYGIPVDNYCGEPFSMSSGWVYDNQPSYFT